MRVKFAAVGMENWVQKLKVIQGRINKEIVSIYEESAQNIYHRARAKAQVDTGAMRAHVKVEIKNINKKSISILIYDDVINEYGTPYAKFLEFGTSRMKAYPFLYPSMEYETPIIKSRLLRLKNKLK